MVGTPASRANIHRPDGKVDRDVTLLEVPRAGRVIERRGRRWLIVEVRMKWLDDRAGRDGGDLTALGATVLAQ
jgi:hypothetical protein